MVQKADRIDPKSEVFGNTGNEKMIQITLQRSCTQVHIPYRTISCSSFKDSKNCLPKIWNQVNTKKMDSKFFIFSFTNQIHKLLNLNGKIF